MLALFAKNLADQLGGATVSGRGFVARRGRPVPADERTLGVARRAGQRLQTPTSAARAGRKPAIFLESWMDILGKITGNLHDGNREMIFR